MNAALSSEQGSALNAAMRALCNQADALAAFLTDQAGNILAGTPYRDEGTVQAIGALGAGTFFATKELASLTGETAFDSVSHQGREIGLYIRSVGTVFLVMVIFDRKSTLGLVKLYTDRVAGELAPLLREVSGQSVVSAGGTVRFEMAEDASVFRGE